MGDQALCELPSFWWPLQSLEYFLDLGDSLRGIWLIEGTDELQIGLSIIGSLSVGSQNQDIESVSLTDSTSARLVGRGSCSIALSAILSLVTVGFWCRKKSSVLASPIMELSGWGKTPSDREDLRSWSSFLKEIVFVASGERLRGVKKWEIVRVKMIKTCFEPFFIGRALSRITPFVSTTCWPFFFNFRT
jgi:hypothetical protein